MSHMIKTGSACLLMLLLAQANVRAADENESVEESAVDTSSVRPAPLSVAPLDQIQYPDDRPAWIEAPASLDALPRTWTVVSGPSETPEQSLENLKLMKRVSVETYLKSLPGADGRLDSFPLTDQWIDDELLVQQYEGQVTQEGLTYYEHAAELRVDRETEREMLAAIQNDAVRQRLGALGVLVMTALSGLIFCSVLVGAISRRVARGESVKVSTL